ncbi:MAG TPA: DUF2807 domain-containing protein, partial [Bacteroidota bacterium]|nr:DUF2807 domain-containing protein [Bacteroidota bacterium]
VGLKDGDYSDVTLKVYVSMKHINSLSIEGAGTIECSNRIETESLECTVNGAGNIDMQGSSHELNCTINGAGNFSGKKFRSNDVTAVLNGAGNCTVYASERIDATVNGVGAITYYGNPENVKSDVSGIGFISRGD